jgi:hypothetical protein
LTKSISMNSELTHHIWELHLTKPEIECLSGSHHQCRNLFHVEVIANQCTVEEITRGERARR